MQQQIPENLKITPFMSAFVIISMQVGIGVLVFPRLIAEQAGHDAWISIIMAALTIHFIVWMMFKICDAVKGDVLTANVYAFGKFIGNGINSFFIFYYLLMSITLLASLIEVIRTWMFNDFDELLFGGLYLLLVIYIVSGGFRTVVGIAFLGIIIPSYLLFSFGYAARYGDFTNLLPILDHTPMELGKAAYEMILSFLGFGSLVFIYPFIKKPRESVKWVHLGLLTTTISYISLAIITFAYFPPKLLQKSIWPTLEMWKIVRLPIVERFEYLGLANWALLVLPSIAISFWIASRVAKQVLRVNQRKFLYILAVVILIATINIDSHERVIQVSEFSGNLGFVLTFFYTPLLFLTVLLKKKVTKK